MNRREFINTSLILGGGALFMEYKDFLDKPISGYVKKLSKHIYPLIVDFEYKGKWSGKTIRKQRQAKGIAYGDKLLTLRHLLYADDEFSGKFIEKNKYYVDQFEKVSEYFTIIERDGNRIDAKKKCSFIKNDVGVLKYKRFGEGGVVRNLDEIKKLGDSDKLKPGNLIFSLVTPLMLKTFLRRGYVTSLSLPPQKGLDLKAFFTHDIDVIFGDSASPIFSMDDGPELVGLITGFNRYNSGEITYKINNALKINEFKGHI